MFHFNDENLKLFEKFQPCCEVSNLFYLWNTNQAIMKKIILLFLLSVTGIKFTSAQDTIYKRNREIIVAKITEIGTDEIKYKIPNYDDGPVIALEKKEVWKIIFANGITQFFQEAMFDASNYVNQHKNAVKADFLSLAFYKLTLAFEHSLQPGLSYETTVGIIGIGSNPDKIRTSSGAFARVGIKFIKSPDFYLKGMRYAHVLKGGYVKPEIFFGTYHEKNLDASYYYNYNYSYTPVSREKDVTFGGIHLAFGKQWVFDNIFLVDNFVSFGYVFDNLSNTDYNFFNETNLYGTLRVSRESPISISAGMKIGVLF